MRYTILAVRDGNVHPDFTLPPEESLELAMAAVLRSDSIDAPGWPEGYDAVVVDEAGQAYEDVTGDGTLVRVGDSPYATPDWTPFEGYEAGDWSLEETPGVVPPFGHIKDWPTTRRLKDVSPVTDLILERSEGHAGFFGMFEYFRIETGELYRAPLANPLGVDGYRQGGRFEATASMAERALAHAAVVFAPEPAPGEFLPSDSKVLDLQTATKLWELFGLGSYMQRSWKPEDLVTQFENYAAGEPNFTLSFFIGMHLSMEEGADLLEPGSLALLKKEIALHWTTTTEIPIEGERTNR